MYVSQQMTLLEIYFIIWEKVKHINSKFYLFIYGCDPEISCMYIFSLSYKGVTTIITSLSQEFNFEKLVFVS